MKRVQLLFLFALLISIRSLGQATFEVPHDVQLNAKEDYTKYETDIINAANWLEETDFDKELNKRKEVGKFFMTWLLGSPTVSVDMNTEVMNLFEDNPKLMTIYFSSAARYILQNKGSATKFNTVKSALVSVIKVYNKQIGISKAKALKKLIAANDSNKLDEYIINEMKVAKN